MTLTASVVFFRKYLWLQYSNLVMTCVTLIITIGHVKTRDKTRDTNMEIFNEVKLILIMYHIICFTDYIDDSETKFLIGFSCCAFVVGGLAVNMFSLIVAPIYMLIRKCKLRYAKQRLHKQRKSIKYDTVNFHKRRLHNLKQKEAEVMLKL